MMMKSVTRQHATMPRETLENWDATACRFLYAAIIDLAVCDAAGKKTICNLTGRGEQKKRILQPTVNNTRHMMSAQFFIFGGGEWFEHCCGFVGVSPGAVRRGAMVHIRQNKYALNALRDRPEFRRFAS